MNPRTTEAKDPFKLVRSGIFALKRNKWAKAKRKFEEALQIEEIQKNSAAWANYGIALVNLKLYPDALKAFTQAVDLDKNNPELYTKKGLIELQLNKFKEAENSFKQALQKSKADPEIYILLGRVYGKQDDHSKQVKILEKALKKVPDSSKIPIELARVWAHQENSEKVEKVLKEAISTARTPEPGLLLGQHLLDQNNLDNALEVYKLVLDRFPSSQHAQYGIGVAYHAKNEFNNALESYMKTLELFRGEKIPQSLFINLARVSKQLGHKKEAIDFLFKAKKAGKTTLEISLLLAELFLEIKRADRAFRALEDAQNLDKDNPIIPYYLGMTSLQLNDPSAAEEHFKRSLLLDPTFHESKFQLANLALQNKQYNEAYILASEIARSKSDHIPARRLAGKTAFLLQKFKESIEFLKPIVIENPQLEDLEILLRAWLMRNESKEAHSFVRNELKINKNLHDQMEKKIFLRQFLKDK